MRYPTKELPEDDKPIRIYGSDCFGKFSADGVYRRYKGSQVQRRKTGRFLMFRDGYWQKDDSWLDANEWEYIK